MIVLRELAPAKINLYLHVTGKRPDGYHLLDSLTVFADIGDKLEVMPAPDITVALTGEFASGLGKDNSVHAAATSLRKTFGITAGAALTLHKNLPIGAGLGGGSADAAATLKLLTRFWKLKPSAAQLQTLAVGLGADVPVCLHGKPSYMGGIGELIEAGPKMSEFAIVLISARKPLLTADVFKRVKAPFSEAPSHPPIFVGREAVISYLSKTRNDLQPIAIGMRPEIQEFLTVLGNEKECLLARMSGSGSACVGLFAGRSQAQEAAQKIAAQHTQWWVQMAGLL